MKKKEIYIVLISLAGVLIIFWGILHAIIIPEITGELMEKSVSTEIISLITLSYTGIIIMISINGIFVIYASNSGLKKEEYWAYFYLLLQGILFCFVSFLLLYLRPKISVIGFSGDFVLILAVFTDMFISILIIMPVIILLTMRKEKR